MVQTIDTIEINTREVFRKKSEYKYYDCEEVANDVKKISKACPRLIGKTERLGVALLNGRSSLPTAAVPTIFKFPTKRKECVFSFPSGFFLSV